MSVKIISKLKLNITVQRRNGLTLSITLIFLKGEKTYT